MSELGQFEILSLFKSNCLSFLDSLIEIFPDEGEILAARILFENHIPVEECIRQFAFRTLPYKEMIKTRNEKFFMTDNEIFSGSDQQKVVTWRQLWNSKRLDNDDRTRIWEWADLFLTLAENYTENLKKINSMQYKQ